MPGGRLCLAIGGGVGWLSGFQPAAVPPPLIRVRSFSPLFGAESNNRSCTVSDGRSWNLRMSRRPLGAVARSRWTAGAYRGDVVDGGHWLGGAGVTNQG